MNFTIEKTLEILERTPSALISLLQGVSAGWTANNEGGETWSVYDVVGHLIHGEKTDWLPRAEIILSAAADKTFPPFDRFAQLEAGEQKSLAQLLEEFAALRKANTEHLRALKITENDLSKTGLHPAFGEVTLEQLLSTWAVHDLDHISQIARVMAAQYKAEVGPWKEYLRIVRP